MRRLTLSVLLVAFFSCGLIAQPFMNVQNKDGSTKYSSVDLVRKLTFNVSGTILQISLTSGVVVYDSLPNLQKITFNNFSSGTPLPVELVSFCANAVGNTVTLSWKTASESNTAIFEIERAAGGSAVWVKVGSVKAAGSSNILRNYIFTDANPQQGILLYRLKMKDNDGSFKYTDGITINHAITASYQLNQNYPNPFNPVTTIGFSIPVQGRVELRIFDVLGNVVATLVNEVKPVGNYTIQFDAGRLSSGVYFCKLVAAGMSMCKKMSLIK